MALRLNFVLSPVSGVFVTVAMPARAGMDRRHGRGARTTRLRRTLRTFVRRAFHAPDATASIANRANIP